MYITCVRHRVRDYAVWRKAFDHNADLLFKKAGAISTTIVQVDGDPHDVVVINTWPSKKQWDYFGILHDSPEYKGKLKTPQDGGVVGEIQFYGGEVLP
jgi:hypothetical protein